MHAAVGPDRNRKSVWITLDFHFLPFFSLEMELTKKKTNRYNNYDDISGTNDEVIKKYFKSPGGNTIPINRLPIVS